MCYISSIVIHIPLTKVPDLVRSLIVVFINGATKLSLAILCTYNYGCKVRDALYSEDIKNIITKWP